MFLRRFVRRLCVGVVALALLRLLEPGLQGLWAQAAQPADIDPELARQQQIVERFVTVLEKNPRRGTALDRIYGFHIENGTIESFVQSLRDRVAAKPDDGAGWMILGLVESQRGRDAAAVEALTKSKDLRTTDPLAAYYQGQSLVLVGQPDKAVAVFEEAIERKPSPVDLFDIFQALGRVHQRAARTPEALEVWSRLERLFPGDARVQEQIASSLVEEGQAAEALPRYEGLAKSTTDDYRRTVYRMDAADLKIKLNRSSEAIADLEQLLAKLNPESWLFREVRRRIEDIFLRTDDQDGLAKYYTAWLAKNSEDIEAMARLARVLARQSRVPEAQEWLDKALKLAPSRKELRLAFIEQLVDDQRYADAIKQYAELDKSDPNNPDYLRDWGKLLLRDTTRPKEERQTEAERIWRRLVAARPTDPLIATQVADLFRLADMQPQALELYQKSVELSPQSPQYREYLGEYYHILKRTDEALATWRKMTDGPQRTATNLARLAEVFAQFGYVKESLPEIAAACELDPKDYALQLKAADLNIRADEFDAALAALARAEKLAQNDEEHEAVLNQQIKTFTLQDKLSDRAAELVAKNAAGQGTPHDWFLLARYRESLHEYPEATRAINESLKLEPNNIPALGAAARIGEQAGDLKTAADLNRRLAVVDRRGRSEYLQRVATLETQLGRIDEALAAGRELIASAPGNIETQQFFADLCFRLNRVEDGLSALRRASRLNPNESSLLLSLGAALAGQFRSDEAIELYWQAFEKDKDLDDKLSVIGKLTELYLQTNHFDQLLERLERGRREADLRRQMTICLAQAYQSAGDYGMARQELEKLLSENTRDTQLLLQLSKLAENESDLAAAVKHQEALAKLAPGPESEYRLATLLSRAGDNQEATAILVRLASKEEDKEKLLRNFDGLLAGGQEETALAILEPKVRENPGDWELLYRQGLALSKRRPLEASRSFQAILELNLPDDEPGIAAKNRQKNQRTSVVMSAGSPQSAQMMRTRWRLNYTYEIRRAIGIERDPFAYGIPSGRPTVWTPQEFSQARMAAIGWLYRLAQDESQGDAFVADRRQNAESPAATSRDLWDFVYLQNIRSDEDGQLAASKRLATRGGPSEKLLFLMKLGSRGGNQNVYDVQPGKEEIKLPPLEPDELELVIKCYDDIRRMSPDPMSEVMYYARAATITVLRELGWAGRKDEERKLYQESIDKANSVAELSAAMSLAYLRRDWTTYIALFDRLATKDLQTVEQRSSSNAAAYREMSATAVAQFLGQTDVPNDDLLKTLDQYLAYHAAKTNQRRSSLTYRPGVRSPSQMQRNYLSIYTGRNQRSIPITFPLPGEYFDQPSLSLLRTAFESFKTKDLASDLIKHVEQYAAGAPAAEKLFALLTLTYMQAWNDDRDAAAATLNRAAELVPQDASLRLDLAQLHLDMQQLDEALAVVEAIAPLDQRVMQQRETMALDLAVRLGDHQRAREAAQRLFGLRLDAETQVSLAGQMRRLGMNEESEAVLARAQRQAGSRLSALAALMGQYQAQGQMEVAAQVAHQILRRSRTAPSAQAALGYSTADSQYRTSALACLAQAGKLKELTAAVEEQIRRAPQATQLYETLAEYYQAAGEAQKTLDLLGQIVALKPDDGELRFRYAQELYRRGKMNEACEQYVAVVKKQPQLMARRYYEVIQAFQRAKKESELAQVLGEIDLRLLGQPHVITNLISNMMRSPGTANSQSRAAGMVLFRKAWQAFPDQRSQLMSYFYDSEMWKLPEVLDYGKQSLLPTAEAARRDPWYGLSSGGMMYQQDGRVVTVVSRLLESAAKNNQLAALHDELAAAVSANPQWRAGPLLLALVDVRQGLPVDSAVFQSLLEPERNTYQLRSGRWLVAQELEGSAAHKDLALKLYEKAAEPAENYLEQFRYSPANRLVRLLKDSGRRDEARQVLLRATKNESGRDMYDREYRLAQRAETLMAVSEQLQELDDPINALRMYRELLTNPDFSDPAISSYNGNPPEFYRRRAEQGLQAITKKFAERPNADVGFALLSPNEKPAAGVGVIDLMVSTAVHGASPLPSLDSPLVKLIRPAGVAAEAVERIQTQLDALVQQFPRDFSVHIAACLFMLQGEHATKSDAALRRLSDLVNSAPLEELPKGKRANARQRTEASQQISLWLVAREALSDSARRDLGQKLAERAVAAAQRQLEPEQLTAILYERGRLALARGEHETAEKLWNDLIDLTLVQPRLPRAGAPAASAGPQPPPRTPTNVATTAPPRGGKMPATLSQFKLGASLSQAAAEQGLLTLSLHAIREALSGGLPVPDLPKAGPNAFGAPSMAMVRPTPAGMPSPRADIDQTVYNELSARLWQLSLVWKRKGFPPDEVCKLLEEMVFPAARPGDVLIYEQPIANDLSNAQSVGKLLVEWAIRAGRTAEVERQVAARQATPSDVVAGQVLVAQLAVAGGQTDRARETLQSIAALVERSKLASLSGLGGHAAAAALDQPQLVSAALPLVEKLAVGPAQQSRNYVPAGGPGPYSPQTILTRHHVQSGDTAAATAQVDRYLQSRQEFYARYSGDSAVQYQRRDLAWAANELARSGNLPATLAVLGRFADMTTTSREQNTYISVALWHLMQQAKKLPASERYELLRDWTLPTKDRRSVRVALGFDGGQPIPSLFFATGPQAPLAPTREPQFAPLSNVTLLVEAAAESGRLNDLLAAVEPLAKEKVPGAEGLAIVLLVAGGDPAAALSRLEALAKALREVVPATNDRANPPPPTDPANYLAARAALFAPELSAAGQRLARILLEQSRRTYHREFVTHIGQDTALAVLTGLSPAERDEACTLPLAHWIAGTAGRASEATFPVPLWSVSEGHLVHHTGSAYDALYFKYPLVGEFEFSYETYRAYFSQSEVGYAGIVCMPIFNGGRTTISSTSQHDQIQRAAMFESNNAWSRVSVRVAPGSVRYYINSHLAYEDRSPSSTSPWLEVHAKEERQPALRNFRLTGQPVIPREVKLIDGDRLDGWNAQFYDEKMPTRMKSAEPPSTEETRSQPYYVLNAAGDYVLFDPSAPVILDWQAAGGVLDGRFDGAVSSRTQSRLYYQRPLADGERLSYQFLYEPGQTHVHPALGRVAFLLEPAGVQLHWMTAGSDTADPLLLDPRNRADDPTSRRGPAALPLKENDWNDLEVAINGDNCALKLNGTLIFERPIEPTNDRRFGLFHFKNESGVKVRNVVLRGNWPEALTPAHQADLLAVSATATPKIQHARQAMLGERFLTDAAYQVWLQSQEMAPQARYDVLKRWVLPGDSHATVRMQVDWTPVDPPPSGSSPVGLRGGDLVSPALVLVATAKELNKLDELATAAALAGKEYPSQERQLNGLEALIAIARGDDAAADERLNRGIQYVKEQPAETPLHERHAEYVVAYASLSRTAGRTIARKLAEEISTDQRLRPVSTEWGRRAARLRATTWWATDAATRNVPFGGDPRLKQWHPVTWHTASGRGEGYGPPSWHFGPGQATYMTGTPHDALYYQAPLRGDFEIRGQFTTNASKVVRFYYGGVGFSMTGDGGTLVRHEIVRGGDTRTLLKEKIPDWGPMAEMKLAASGGMLTYSVNGKELASQRLPGDADPWFAIQPGSGNQTSMVQALKITGTPVIPCELALTAGAGLEGWSAMYYGETISASTDRPAQPQLADDEQPTSWSKSGDEIVAGKRPNCEGSFRESILQYHRPVLEDGELEYEFFYEPGRTLTHPAIDRLVFLLSPEGTKIHWLTDKQFDRTGIAVDNVEPLAGATPMPLKAGEWNKLKLVLAGDVATIFVNGQEVARRTLESTNQRVFGLFRFADATSARVRQVVYRGQWPTVLPALDKQELATAPPAAVNAAKKAKAKKK
jgi:tetratricopeptide (TPR) repeat protein